MENTLVSVCSITYNHEKYISQMIESVLFQKTNFNYVLVIGEDCSTDNTREICISYKAKYPDKIELILNEKNIGGQNNFINVLNKCQGKYIAICEGDDYWTDSYKLQKQVDFLETNEKISFCFHNAVTYFVDRDVSTKDFNHKLKSQSYNTNDFLMKSWFIPTASLLIRKSMLPNPFPEWYSKVYNWDYVLELLFSIKGDAFYINKKMSVYRKNAIDSLSIKGLKGMDSLKKRLFLLKEFKNSNANKNTFVNNYAIAKVRYNQLKVARICEAKRRN